MREEGYEVSIRNAPNLVAVKQEHQVPFELQSCHTAIVDGYVIEGHVPATEVKRLLAEWPSDIIGLAVPGMPIGSPGMEGAGADQEAYQVLAFDAAGNTRVYASYSP